jgi:hypothetical protein
MLLHAEAPRVANLFHRSLFSELVTNEAGG